MFNRLPSVLVRTFKKFAQTSAMASKAAEIFNGNTSNEGITIDPKNNRLIWIDCEMSGLEPETCHLLEIACLISDRDSLKIVAEGPSLIISQPRSVLDAMDDWCKEQHARSGLVQSVLDSKIKLEEAENLVLDFVREHTNPGVCPLAGNSVHVDRNFLSKYMPRLAAHLHYRIVDVSSIKELCKSWYPLEYKNAPKKKVTHRAMDDIRESIAELDYYRRSIFK